MDEYVTTFLYYNNHIQIKVETNFFLMYPLIIPKLAKRIHSHVANPYKCVSEVHQPAEHTGKKVIKNETIYFYNDLLDHTRLYRAMCMTKWCCNSGVGYYMYIKLSSFKRFKLQILGLHLANVMPLHTCAVYFELIELSLQSKV